MRMFVALVPPAGAVEDLEEFLAPRRASGPFRWATQEQFHVTLAFLEQVEERRIDEFEERLERAARRRTPFTARISGGGAFPNPGKARVLWSGLALDETGEVELPRLATGTRAAANRSGIAVDGQRFKPHLTLARLGRPAEVSNWVRLLDAYVGPAWPADRVELIASYLGEGPRNRPRYETVAELPLGKEKAPDDPG